MKNSCIYTDAGISIPGVRFGTPPTPLPYLHMYPTVSDTYVPASYGTHVLGVPPRARYPRSLLRYPAYRASPACPVVLRTNCAPGLGSGLALARNRDILGYCDRQSTRIIRVLGLASPALCSASYATTLPRTPRTPKRRTSPDWHMTAHVPPGLSA